MRRLEAVPVWRVLGALVVAQWLVVLGIALVVRHNGWIYYQGGDQLWYYTTGWLLGHGTFPQPGVGYLWCVLLAPISLVAGPNVGNAYPAIIVLQFVFLLPIALVTTYGIALRIGGRLFAYWAAFLWVVIPLIGIKFTDAGYHQRFTETLLPQGFGLTAMADLPTTVAALLSMYYCARLLSDEDDRTFDGLAAGLAGGAAVAIKPATALVLFGPALAFVVTRYWRAAALYLVGILPSVITLTFVKWRGFGYLPLLHPSAVGERVAAGRQLLAGGGTLGHYLPFHVHQFLTQLDQVREHFWSVRVIEWLVVAGLIAVFLRSRRFGALLLGWFAPIILIKTGSARADMEGGGLLRVLMPAYPAFVLMIAALPFLFPSVARRPSRASTASSLLRRRQKTVALVAALLITAVIPLAAYAAASPQKQGPGLKAALVTGPPVPIGIDMHLQASRAGNAWALSWQPTHAQGGAIFYEIFSRLTDFPEFGCSGSAAVKCGYRFTQIGTTRSTHWIDAHPSPGPHEYYVGVAANWLNDVTQGDVYVVSRGVSVNP